MNDELTSTQARLMKGGSVVVGAVGIGVFLFELLHGEADGLDLLSSGALLVAALSLYSAGKNASEDTNLSES